MKRVKNISTVLGVCVLLAVAMLGGASRWAGAEDAPKNLALEKTATASSTESDDHAPGKAVDGNNDTRWCADGDATGQWWEVDLGAAADLTGCEIRWEFDGKKYGYLVEGSADEKTWMTLSDQKATDATTQVQTLKFTANNKGVRYVRITVTSLDDGCWASIFEVKVF